MSSPVVDQFINRFGPGVVVLDLLDEPFLLQPMLGCNALGLHPLLFSLVRSVADRLNTLESAIELFFDLAPHSIVKVGDVVVLTNFEAQNVRWGVVPRPPPAIA